tara:strand:+ start:258 stop:1886 length:1629 start_codon:yes stop_codon:yes gene_type:complete
MSWREIATYTNKAIDRIDVQADVAEEKTEDFKNLVSELTTTGTHFAERYKTKKDLNEFADAEGLEKGEGGYWYGYHEDYGRYRVDEAQLETLKENQLPLGNKSVDEMILGFDKESIHKRFLYDPESVKGVGGINLSEKPPLAIDDDPVTVGADGKIYHHEQPGDEYIIETGTEEELNERLSALETVGSSLSGPSLDTDWDEAPPVMGGYGLPLVTGVDALKEGLLMGEHKPLGTRMHTPGEGDLGKQKYQIPNTLGQQKNKIPNTLGMQKNRVMYKDMASAGKFGDTEIRNVDGEPSHVNKEEAEWIDYFGKLGEMATKAYSKFTGGADGERNEETNAPQYYGGGAGKAGSLFSSAGSLASAAGLKVAGKALGPIGMAIGLGLEAYDWYAGAKEKAKQAQVKIDKLDEGIKKIDQQRTKIQADTIDSIDTLWEGVGKELDDVQLATGSSIDKAAAITDSIVHKGKGLKTGDAALKAAEIIDEAQEGYDVAEGKLVEGYDKKTKAIGMDLQRESESMGRTMEDMEQQIEELEEETNVKHQMGF